MLPILSTQRVTTTVYQPACQHRGSTDAPVSVPTVPGPRTVQFRPAKSLAAYSSMIHGATTTTPPTATETDARRFASAVPSRRVATAPPSIGTHGRATPNAAEPAYWNRQAHWQAGAVNGTAVCEESDKLARSEDEDDDDLGLDSAFLVNPIAALKRGGGTTRRRPPRLAQIDSAAVTRAKADASERLTRLRAATGESAPPARPLATSSTGATARAAVTPPATVSTVTQSTQGTDAAVDQDANKCAVRALFRRMLAGADPDDAAEDVEQEDDDGAARDAAQDTDVAQGNEKLTTRSSAAHGPCTNAPRAVPRRDDDGPVSVYNLRATALHPLPSVAPPLLVPQPPSSSSAFPRGSETDSSEPLIDIDNDGMTIEAWHMLYARRASAESAFRWLLYQEQYERALLLQMEQAQCPIAFYTPQPAADTHALALRRRHAHATMTTDADIHDRLNSALRRLSRPRGGAARPPYLAGDTDSPFFASHAGATTSGSSVAPSPDSPSETLQHRSTDTDTTVVAEELARRVAASTVAAQLAGAFAVASEEKAQLYQDGLELLTVLSKQKALVQEEAAARSELVRDHYALSPVTTKESLGESATSLFDTVDMSTQFACIVLEGLPALYTELLAEREAELTRLHNLLTLQIIALHVFDRFARDESRQWEKLMSYHAFCQRLAATATASTAVAVPDRGSRADNDSANCSVSAEDAPPAAAAPSRFCASGHDPIQRLRQQRLRYIGPTDSPFCSYVRYLEISITDRTEGESRARAVSEEARERAQLDLAADQSRQRVAIWGASQTGAAAVAEAEAEARSRLHERLASGATAILACEARARAVEEARRAAENRVRLFCEDAYEQKHVLENTYLAEHLKVFRALRAECLLLAIQKSYEDKDPAEMVLNWSVERSIFILVQREHRLRHAIVEEELAVRNVAIARRDFVEQDLWPSRCRVVRDEADAWQCLTAVFFDEHVCRARIAAAAAHERAVLFMPTLPQPKGVLVLVPAAHTDATDAHAAGDGHSLAFSASHLSQVVDCRADEEHRHLPLIVPRSLNDTERDTHLVLTSNATSSDLRIPTFQSSLATSLPLSHSARTYWDSAENAPLDARGASGTFNADSGFFSASGEGNLMALQQRLLQSYGRRTDEDMEFLDTLNSLPNQLSPSAVDQPLMTPMPMSSSGVASVAAAGSRREVTWGKTETIVCDSVPDISPPWHRSPNDLPSIANAYVSETSRDGAAPDDCPFPSLLFALEEDKDLDLRRTILANLSQFCTSDDLMTFFA